MRKLSISRLNLFVEKVLHRSQLKGIYVSRKWKYLLFPVIIYLSFSCQDRSAEKDNQVIGYSVDTVIIDSKGRLLDLINFNLTSDLDNEETSLYLFNRFDLSIDEINLNQKEYVKSYPLEAEGPNGVGEFIINLQWLNDSLIFAESSTVSSLIDRNGHLVKRIVWEDARDSSGVKFDQNPRKNVVSGTVDLKVFGLDSPNKKKEIFLYVLSVGDNIVKKFDVDPENSYQDFYFRFDDNSMPPGVYLSSDSNYIRISHEFSNEIILFNPEGEFVKVVHYEPQLTPKRAKIPGGAEIKSRDQVRREFQHMLEQVRFEPAVWDNVKNRYLRLSSKRIFTDTYTDENFFVPETKEIIVFLSIFDAEFNLISEIEIDELDGERLEYFAKDGKLWIGQNFSDELGFLVFDL